MITYIIFSHLMINAYLRDLGYLPFWVYMIILPLLGLIIYIDTGIWLVLVILIGVIILMHIAGFVMVLEIKQGVEDHGETNK